jgi:hypothetical protein
MSDEELAEQAAACFENASQIERLRRSDPTERAAEMVEWMCSEGWRRMAAFARAHEWDVLQEAL